MAVDVDFQVEHADITAFAADVVAVKYAGNFYGVSTLVAQRLSGAGQSLDTLRPDVGKYALVPTAGTIQARNALMVGVLDLWHFRYAEIQAFSATVLNILARELPEIRHIALPLHGLGYGLDEIESFLSTVEGCLQGLGSGNFPRTLQRISIVDINADRVNRLRHVLVKRLAQAKDKAAERYGEENQGGRSPFSGSAAEAKSHVFVAMPFTPQLEDIFHYGIQGPVRDAGFLCERIDHVAFTGGIFDWITKKIESARVVIAELSDGNPNVFLEVGYAWGKGKPTVLLVDKLEHLPFDVQGHKCLVYEGRIKLLEEQLRYELGELQARKLI